MWQGSYAKRMAGRSTRVSGVTLQMAGTFLRVACTDCENEQIVFNRAATPVKCTECGTQLARPTGGAAAIEGDVVELLQGQ